MILVNMSPRERQIPHLCLSFDECISRKHGGACNYGSLIYSMVFRSLISRRRENGFVLYMFVEKKKKAAADTRVRVKWTTLTGLQKKHEVEVTDHVQSDTLVFLMKKKNDEKFETASKQGRDEARSSHSVSLVVLLCYFFLAQSQLGLWNIKNKFVNLINEQKSDSVFWAGVKGLADFQHSTTSHTRRFCTLMWRLIELTILMAQFFPRFFVFFTSGVMT